MNRPLTARSSYGLGGKRSSYRLESHQNRVRLLIFPCSANRRSSVGPQKSPRVRRYRDRSSAGNHHRPVNIPVSRVLPSEWAPKMNGSAWMTSGECRRDKTGRAFGGASGLVREVGHPNFRGGFGQVSIPYQVECRRRNLSKIPKRWFAPDSPQYRSRFELAQFRAKNVGQTSILPSSIKDLETSWRCCQSDANSSLHAAFRS